MSTTAILLIWLALLSPLAVAMLLLVWRQRGLRERQRRARLARERYDRQRYP
jgi:hypothetical protein